MSKTTGTSKSSPELERLPKASDFKLPKKLDKLAIRRIETGKAIMEGFRHARENGQNSEK